MSSCFCHGSTHLQTAGTKYDSRSKIIYFEVFLFSTSYRYGSKLRTRVQDGYPRRIGRMADGKKKTREPKTEISKKRNIERRERERVIDNQLITGEGDCGSQRHFWHIFQRT
jgi:hypothetical protein